MPVRKKKKPAKTDVYLRKLEGHAFFEGKRKANVRFYKALLSDGTRSFLSRAEISKEFRAQLHLCGDYDKVNTGAEDSQAEEVWEVDEILERDEAKRKYLVKWKGKTRDGKQWPDTWESETAVAACTEAIERFVCRKAQERRKQRIAQQCNDSRAAANSSAVSVRIPKRVCIKSKVKSARRSLARKASTSGRMDGDDFDYDSESQSDDSESDSSSSGRIPLSSDSESSSDDSSEDSCKAPPRTFRRKQIGIRSGPIAISKRKAKRKIVPKSINEPLLDRPPKKRRKIG